jgi:xylose isomerase
VAAIAGVEGIELRYPVDFEHPAEIGRLLQAHGLALSAVNIDLKDARLFRYGALSARSDAAREAAVGRIREGMDLAADLGAGIVTTCPLADGFEYPFQVDYSAAWAHMLASIRQAAPTGPTCAWCSSTNPTTCGPARS